MLTFFGGKGGVGKTTLSNAYALGRSKQERVLVVSTDPAHNLGHLWHQEIGPEPVTVRERLDLVELDPEKATRAHLAQAGETMRAHMPERLHKEVDKHLELAATSPGTHEAALLEQMAALIEDHEGAYDHIIFDTAPSGHTARLMALPELMSAWTDGLLKRRDKADKFADVVGSLGGETKSQRRDAELRSILYRRRTRFEHLRDALRSSTFNIVLTAERLPVMETIELYAELAEHRIPVGGLFINRRSPAALPGRRAVEEEALAMLCAALPDVPITELPLLDYEVGSPEALEEIATYLQQ